MGDLTNNISRHELLCACGCGLDSMDFETIEMVQDACDEFDCTVEITSAARCYEYNRSDEVGSNDRSQHPRCRGMDCKFKGQNPKDVHEYLCNRYPNRFGFGLYKTFNHIDSRTNGPARWDNS